MRANRASGPEKSAAMESIAGALKNSECENPYFVGFHRGTALAAQTARSKGPRRAAFVGVLPCCLLLALRRPHWTP
jgi:hypothetical protein